MPTPEALAVLATNAASTNKKFFQRVKKKKPKDLDRQVHKLHEEAFEQMDCLTCANCCKTTSPIITPKDIDRIAKSQNMPPAKFVEQYLKIDDDGDYVFTSAPCPFLGGDNYCSIYENRPNACREYPHTDRRKVHQALKVTEKNVGICPAVYYIVEKLKTIY